MSKSRWHLSWVSWVTAWVIGFATVGIGHAFPADDSSDDAILLHEEMEIEVLSESEAIIRYQNRTKVLTQDGVDRYDTVSINYNPWIAIRKVEAATVTPDGKRQRVKKKLFWDSSDYDSYELYSESRIKNISFPGVVPGSIIEYSYELTLKSLFFLPSGFLLQQTIPTRSKTLILRAPSSVPVRTSLRGKAQYVREETGGIQTHRWQVKDVPPLRGEDYMPPAADLFPRVSIYPKQIEFEDYRINSEQWKGIAEWYWEMARERMKPTPEVAATAKRLTVGMIDPAEKTRAIFEYLRDEINYVAIYLGIGGWQPHSSGEVLSHQYGDCKDKATLMVAMLQSLDLPGYPALIRTRPAGRLERDYPSSDFDHAIVAVPGPEGYLFLDPTDDTTAFGDLPWADQGVSILVVKEGGEGDFVQTPLHKPEKNRRHRTVTATISNNGSLKGSYLVDAWGQRRAWMTGWMGAEATVEREDSVEDYLAYMCPGSLMKEHRIQLPSSPTDPWHLAMEFEVPRFVTRAGSRLLITPHLARFPQITELSLYSSRIHPVFFRYLYSDTSEVRLTLPPGRKVGKLPQAQKVAGPGVVANTEYELVQEQKKQILVVTRSLEVTRREIPAADFPALQEFLSALARQDASGFTLE